MPVVKFIDKNGGICEMHINQILEIDGKGYEDNASKVQELEDRMLRVESQMEVVLGAMFVSGEQDGE